MRDIKFRGKHKDTGEWVYGDLVRNVEGAFAVVPPYKMDMNNICSDYEVSPETVGQFTGLHDTNGKEIYEGDIVKAPLLDPIFGDILLDAFCNTVIEFNNGAFVVSYYGNSRKIYLQDLCDKIEVIGNIHDTPELLNEK